MIHLLLLLTNASQWLYLLLVQELHQQNTSVLVDTCDLLEQLGSNPRKIPRTIQDL